MKGKLIYHMLACILLSVLLFTCPSAEDENQPPTGGIDPEAIPFVKNLGIGWNLGNTLEACGDWINPDSISNFETAWGNPLTTQAMIDGIKAVGFKTVRIPVAWSNLMSSDYTIHPDLLNRVEEVVNYVLNDDMYAIVNLHWDGGWIANFPTQYEECMTRYARFWTQISEHFKDYSEHLILESMNEEGCWNDVWNQWGGNDSTKQEAYDILNNINQEFVNIVRDSGGNNSTRYLLIAGYSTDIRLTCDDAFHLPIDPAKRMIVSVHYYTPSTFTILTEDADWGEMATTWGTNEEIAVLQNDMNTVKTYFLDAGVPVIVGEYTCVRENKEPESVLRWRTRVANTAYDVGCCPVFWDGGGDYNRYTCTFDDQELENMFRALADKPRP